MRVWMLFSLLFAAMPTAAQWPDFYKTVDRVVWVVGDVERVVPSWSKTGLVKIDQRGDAASAGARVITGWLGDLRVDWVQPDDSRGPCGAFLARHGDGVFAILHRTPTPEALERETDRLRALGVAILERGERHGLRYVYFDTAVQGRYVLGLVSGGEQGAAPEQPKINQLAFALHDPRPVSDYWEKLGFPRMAVSRAGLTDVRYRGQPVLIKQDIGWHRHGKRPYEWIVPVEGPNIFDDHMRAHGEGFQHLGLPVADFDGAVEEWRKAGYSVTQSGRWGELGRKGSGRFAYLDTEKIGGVALELLWNFRENAVSGSGDGRSGCSAAQTLCVSPDGPLKTLTAARDKIRELRRAGARGAMTVLVRGGAYFLPEPLVLTPEDSDVTYAAYPNEHPVLSGGRRIQGWRRAPGEAPTRMGPLWIADVPEAKEGRWDFRQLWINGQRRRRARTPSEGSFYIDGQMTADKQARFKYRPGDFRPEWAGQEGAEVVVLQKWFVMRMPIQALEEATRTVTLTGRHPVPNYLEPRARYWVENTPDALDAPGEWYLDRREGVLRYRVTPDDDMQQAEVIAPVTRQLVRLEAPVEEGKFVERIRLRGLEFVYTDWSTPPQGQADPQAAFRVPAAIEAVGARSCAVENCVFRHLGQYAVQFGRGSKQNRITGNQMSDLGAGGVKIGLELRIVQAMKVVPPALLERLRDENQASSDNVVSDNRIYDIGHVYPDAVGIWVGQSRGNQLAHNEIHDTYCSGVSVGWTWGFLPTAARDNIIEFNHIYNIGRGLLSDMGCVYTVGIQPGTVVRNNLCHDVSGYEYGGWGLYLDDASSQILVENNVVYRTRDGGYHNQYGQQNVVRNNVFALGRRAQLLRTRLAQEISFTFERNIVYWKEGVLLTGAAPGAGRWEEGKVRFDHNLYFHAGPGPVLFGKFSFEEWQKRDQDAHSLIADPLFADPERGDFTLKPGSPALKLGFQPIDLSRVGPRN